MAPPRFGACERTSGPTHGSVLDLMHDGSRLVVVNRDYEGSVAVFEVDNGTVPHLARVSERSLFLEGEPAELALHPCRDTAYVIEREFQEVVEVADLAGEPSEGRREPVGSEPTGVAIAPDGLRLYVANWVDGTVSVVDTNRMELVRTIDLNETLLARSDVLGLPVDRSRQALAHPRSVAVTADGETVYVTEFFAQRIAPHEPDGNNADTNHAGFLYRIDVSGPEPKTSLIRLAPLEDTGFRDSEGQKTGCFPNQLQTVRIVGDFVYVLSICASPEGPTGSKPSDIKSTTHPVLHVVDRHTDEVKKINLNTLLVTRYEGRGTPDDASRRFPLVANDIAIDPERSVAWVTANGADAVFRFAYDRQTGLIENDPEHSGRPYIDLNLGRYEDVKERSVGRGPLGLVLQAERDIAFVANDISRNVTLVDTAAARVAAESGDTPAVFPSDSLPIDEEQLAQLEGRGLFNTGLGRWSYKGQAWGACQTCHFEGYSDNVTWYLPRGPRQSISLEASFYGNDSQRIFNWTAVFDELSDFEQVARGLNGASGAIARESDAGTLEPIDLEESGVKALNGSTGRLDSVFHDWEKVEAWVRTIRSPRPPTWLGPPDAIEAGRALFEEKGCSGCHGGPAWTVSKRFYTPSAQTNTALLETSYDGPALVGAGFPERLLPAPPAQQFMRFPSPAGDQIQCVLRDVGTYGRSPAGVGVAEVRNDMKTSAQGKNGYNVPSLLGLSTKAPYFHAGNARTLEELLGADEFRQHTHALAAEPDAAGAPLSEREIDQLVVFLLSIDNDTDVLELPDEAGHDGGDFCRFP